MKTAILDIFLNLAMVLMVAYGVVAGKTGRGDAGSASIATLVIWLGTDPAERHLVTVKLVGVQNTQGSAPFPGTLNAPPEFASATMDGGWLRWSGELNDARAIEITHKIVRQAGSPAPAGASFRSGEEYMKRLLGFIAECAESPAVTGSSREVRVQLLRGLKELMESSIQLGSDFDFSRVHASMVGRLQATRRGEPPLREQEDGCYAALMMTEYRLRRAVGEPAAELVHGDERQRALRFLLARWPLLRSQLDSRDLQLVRAQAISGGWGAAVLVRSGVPSNPHAPPSMAPTEGPWQALFPPFTGTEEQIATSAGVER